MKTIFIKGRVYNRREELHKVYGGNRQSGIAACANYPIIFLFSTPKGEEHGYADKWISEDIFLYTGEGQFGDMELIRGNLAIKNHKDDGRHLFLFQQIYSGHYQYIGEFDYISHEIRTGIDTDQLKRKTIVFHLRKIQ